MKRSAQLGATTVEMTLVGIPIIFILICIFEISRGMWMYHTLAYAVKAGVRYTIVHGANCATAGSDPNTCLVTIGVANTTTTPNLPAIATVIQNAAVGVDPSITELIFKTNAGTATSCYMGTPGARLPYGGLSACSTYNTTWPPNDTTSDIVGQPIQIQIQTPFYSALSFFWPGTKAVKFALVNLYASSTDYIQF